MKILFAVLLLASCGAAQDEAALTKAKAACGPDQIQFDLKTRDISHSIAQPEAGKALIYVVGQDNRQDLLCKGCAVIARVGMDGAWLGAVNGNSFLAAQIEPGEHHLCTKWQSHFSLRSRQIALANFTAEAEKIYYFRMRVVEGISLDLDAVNSDEGRYLVLTTDPGESHAKK